MGSSVIVLLQIFAQFWQWNNLENRLVFGVKLRRTEIMPFFWANLYIHVVATSHISGLKILRKCCCALRSVLESAGQHTVLPDPPRAGSGHLFAAGTPQRENEKSGKEEEGKDGIGVKRERRWGQWEEKDRERNDKGKGKKRMKENLPCLAPLSQNSM